MFFFIVVDCVVVFVSVVNIVISVVIVVISSLVQIGSLIADIYLFCCCFIPDTFYQSLVKIGSVIDETRLVMMRSKPDYAEFVLL